DARDISSFRDVLNLAIQQTLNKTTISVELLDANDKPTETDVNVTFVNNITGEPVYNFVHFRDQRGKPDSVEIDGVISYDLVVNTIPPVVRENVDIIPGKHNTITIPTPQGYLNVEQKGHTEYENGVKVAVRKAGSAQIVNYFDIPKKEKYLIGNYDLEILTLPRIQHRNLSVEPFESTTLSIPSPGVLNINASVRGVGSLYEVNEQGQQRW